MSILNKVFRTTCTGVGLGALTCLLNACAPDATSVPSAQPHQSTNAAYQVVVDGGDTMMQQWTMDAVSAYCTHKVWPRSLRRIHRPATVNTTFNQPRKTRVLVSHDNTLHIHFELGGVLMDNYSHELIITPPTRHVCLSHPIHYQVTMQPNGDAVIYRSNPLRLTTTDL